MSHSEETEPRIVHDWIKAELEAALFESMTQHDATQLQFEEVLHMLSGGAGCTLVHVESEQEVDIYKWSDDETHLWVIRTSHYNDIPDRDVLMNALREGFQLREPAPCNPRRFELYQHCHTQQVAASQALKVARCLRGVPPNGWLWVTVSEPDERSEPPTPPSPWPPGVV